ncbi:N/A [soil metagenome]
MVRDKSNHYSIYRMFVVSTAFIIMIGAAGCSRVDREPVVIDSAPAAETTVTVNINTAGSDELMTIPHVGERTAAKIIEHRERFGPFRKVEQLMLVEGISDQRFRRIRHMLRVE